MHGIRASDVVKRAVSAILLFGDPYLNFGAASTANLPVNDNARVFDACNNLDIVCNRPNSLGKGTSHLGYTGQTVNDAVAFAKQAVAK